MTVLLMVACGAREAPVTQTATKTVPATSSAPVQPREVSVVIPTAEQLVRSYQGQVEDKNGKRWMLLEIKHAKVTDTGVDFRYTLNYPNEREDESGVLARDGRIHLKWLAGIARVDGSDVILESDAIDGLPYWHVVGHAPVK
jgi:hypothetical protein